MYAVMVRYVLRASVQADCFGASRRHKKLKSNKLILKKRAFP